MTTRTRVEQGLEDIGACWAVRSDKYTSPNDGYDAKPTYHVHPDRTEPRQNAIKRFDSLAEIWSWIQACKQSAALYEKDGQFHEVVWTGDGYDVVR